MKLSSTKIVCTIGPASKDEETLKGLVNAGMSVARLNFSHGTHKEHMEYYELIRKVESECGRPIAILQDLSGPKIRIGEFEKPPVKLKPGAEFTIIAGGNEIGDETKVCCNYPHLADDLKPSNIVLLADGTIELEVEKIIENKVICKVILGGELGNHKGINLKSGTLNAPALTEKDKKDLEFGLNLGVDLIALSFVRSASDILEARSIIEKHGLRKHIIAKIERHEAIGHLDEIIDVTDGVMVARGDLGVEVEFSEVPILQKKIIHKCNRRGKPVIVATQMLKSMIASPRPTRAEANDVANAIIDGADAVMLSEETAIGNYPVEAVKTLAQIADTMEAEQHWRERYRKELEDLVSKDRSQLIQDVISKSAFEISGKLDVVCLLVPTSSGSTARKIARFRPKAKILALSDNLETIKFLTLCWGVIPYYVPGFGHLGDIIAGSTQIALNEGFGKPDDQVVIIAGYPVDKPGTTNLIKLSRLPKTKETPEITRRIFSGDFTKGISSEGLQ